MTRDQQQELLHTATLQVVSGKMTGSRVLTCCAYAIAIDNQEALRELLPKVDHVDIPMKGESLLAMACRVGNLEAVKVLVEEFNADISYSDIGGRVPADIAFDHGHIEIYDYLSLNPVLAPEQVVPVVAPRLS
ncbi:ankyrin repeat domain-containing protein [Methylobacillus sp. Pita2]|uniref:ankyrin repeat domain-containing protein n=1 Tax=Methylobacillus sp. Pita2 TaxID=3383245 RepID=UPI0038B67E16